MAEKTSFESRLKRLEDIVAKLEDGDVGLDDAVKKYQDGMKLLRELEGHLGRLEKKIEVLTAAGATEPFATDESADDSADEDEDE